MAKEKGEVVGVAREWQPAHSTDLTHIQSAIDSWGRAPGDEPRPRRDYAAIEAAVDRITKRVKTRKVVVTETVTEYVDEDVAAESYAANEAPAVDQADTNALPVEEGKKLGWFARRKQAKAEKAQRAEPVFNIIAPTPTPAPEPGPAAQTNESDAWDPGTARQVEAAKPLQSKAAKRTAGKTGKKSSKKKR